MKVLVAALATLMLFTFATETYAQNRVRGYYRKDGTYVQPHYRSKPDGNPFNNWSTKGNVNPYTGKPGTKNPYRSYTTPRRQSNPYGQRKRRW